MDGATGYVVARAGGTKGWTSLTQTTAATATVPWLQGLTEYVVLAILPSGQLTKIGDSVWTFR